MPFCLSLSFVSYLVDKVPIQTDRHYFINFSIIPLTFTNEVCLPKCPHGLQVGLVGFSTPQRPKVRFLSVPHFLLMRLMIQTDLGADDRRCL